MGRRSAHVPLHHENGGWRGAWQIGELSRNRGRRTGDRARVRVEVLDEPDVEERREVGRRPQELILEELVQEGVGLRRVICSPPEPQTASSRLAPCSGALYWWDRSGTAKIMPYTRAVGYIIGRQYLRGRYHAPRLEQTRI